MWELKVDSGVRPPEFKSWFYHLPDGRPSFCDLPSLWLSFYFDKNGKNVNFIEFCTRIKTIVMYDALRRHTGKALTIIYDC